MTEIGYRRRLAGLGALILALACLYLFATIRGTGESAARAAGRALLPGFDPAKVRAVALVAPGRPAVRLEKTGTAWRVVAGERSFPANGARVAALLEGLGALRTGKTMSRNPGLLARFGLAPSAAGRVRIEGAGGSLLADILVGKRGPSGNEDYISLEGNAEAHLTGSALGFYLSRDVSYWYDLAVLPYDVTGPKIAEITISGVLPSAGGGYVPVSYRLVRGERGNDGWQVARGGRELDQLKVESAASSLATLQGVDLLAGASRAPSAGRRLRVVVATDAGARYGFRAWPVGDGRQFHVIRDGSSVVYLVNAAALRRAVLPLPELARLGG